MTSRNYNVIMKAKIIQIGNSRGVRLTRVLLEQAHLTDDVQIEATPNQIVIRSAHAPREGWEDAFRTMAQRGDDVLQDGLITSSFDDTEWKW
jgi:antitoxin MazE